MKKAFRIAIWIALAYAVLESGFRLYKLWQLKADYRKNTRYGFSTFKAQLYTVDPKTGYAYLPNARNHQWLYDQDGNLLPHSSNVVTNNFGMMIPTDVAIGKPKDEFRIGILGDSFCATTTSNVNWPSALERVLNQNEALKKQTGKAVFKVLNFGLDGTGIVQWPSVYENKAARFDSDLVIVNFISDDIFRKFIYRNTLRVASDDYAMFTCTSLPAQIRNRDCQNGLCFVIDPTKEDYKEHASRIKDEIYTALIHRLPWFSPYPELPSTILGGRLGLKPRLVIRPSSNPHYVSAQEAIEASYAALKTIASMHSKTLIFFHPTVEQCVSKETPPAVTRLIEQAKDMNVVNMLSVLPIDAGQEEINKWYNVPHDSHPSSYGASVYARAAEKQIAVFLKDLHLKSGL